jgi:hypothetical protein
MEDFALQPKIERTPGEVLDCLQDAVGQTIKSVSHNGDMVSFIFTDDSALVLNVDSQCDCDDCDSDIEALAPRRVEIMHPATKYRLGLLSQAQRDFLLKQLDQKQKDDKKAYELKQLADLKAKYERQEGDYEANR